MVFGGFQHGGGSAPAIAMGKSFGANGRIKIICPRYWMHLDGFPRALEGATETRVSYGTGGDSS